MRTIKLLILITFGLLIVLPTGKALARVNPPPLATNSPFGAIDACGGCTGGTSCISGTCQSGGGGSPNYSTDAANCGSSGHNCKASGDSSATCSGGSCMCSGTLDDCGTVGCVDTTTSATNCGSCANDGGENCKASGDTVATCNGGSGGCTCDPSNSNLADCGTGQGGVSFGCTDTTSDPNNCGGCSNNGNGENCQGEGDTSATCASSWSCNCDTADGWQDTGWTGCVNTNTDPGNCGSIYNDCLGGTCSSGTCTCQHPDNTSCGNGTCLDSDTYNCGSCGKACAQGKICISGSCVAGPSDPTSCNVSRTCPGSAMCSRGLCQCNSGIYNDNNNCGGCGNACNSDQTCSAGTCVAVNLCGNGGCAATNCSNVTNVGQKCSDGNEYAGGNLEITPVDAGPMSWFSAQTYCQSLGAGWSLPSEEQLSAMNVTANNNGSSQNNTLGVSSFFWSSTQNGAGDAWGQAFGDGYQGSNYEGDDNSVRCVRSL